MRYSEQNSSFIVIYMPPKRIFACTPVSFHADEKFWIRDTGLICRHLRMLGVESKCIMLGPAYADDIDTEYVIRAELRDLKSSSWWRAQELDGVVLYSWAIPRYTSVARAVREAGIPFSVHWDGGGDLRPDEGLPWFQKPWEYLKFRVQDYLRAKHLALADVVTIAPSVRDFLCARYVYRRAHLAEKAIASPCPVSSKFCYEGQPKDNLIIAIGRWDDEEQKRPDFLMRTLEHFYLSGNTVASTEIYGTLTPALRSWHAALPESVRARITLKGYLPNAQLKSVYNRARVIVCTSSHESSHIVSAEALCCGCSVVVTNLPKSLSVLHWYCSHRSGRISERDTPESLAAALSAEMKAWEKGERHPESISAAWQPHFHADRLYSAIFKL